LSLRTSELKNRVIARKKKLEALIAELKADTQGKTADEIARVKGMLRELEKTLKGDGSAKDKMRELEKTLKNGVDGLTGNAKKRLKDWLDK